MYGAIVSKAGLSVKETGYGKSRRTEIVFRDVSYSVVDDAGVVGLVCNKIYDFAPGAILVKGAVADLTVLGANPAGAKGLNTAGDWDGDFGVGTVVGAGATLASTEQNIIPTTEIPQAVAFASTIKGVSTSTEAGKVLDGTGTAIDLYLNILIDDADQDATANAATLTLNGSITIDWEDLGDK